MMHALSYINAYRIKSFHGSFSQEKALVTGYEAANHVLDYFGYGEETRADIIPVEPDEAHIVIARQLRKATRDLVDMVNPFSDFFML